MQKVWILLVLITSYITMYGSRNLKLPKLVSVGQQQKVHLKLSAQLIEQLITDGPRHAGQIKPGT